jgi:hypothetical protein
MGWGGGVERWRVDTKIGYIWDIREYIGETLRYVINR